MSLTPRSRSNESVKRSSFVSVWVANGVLTGGIAGPSLGPREAMIVGEELAAELLEAGPGLRVLVLDLSDVHIVSSIGLGMCIDVCHRAHASGIRAVLFGLCPELAELFEAVKMDRLCTIVRSADQLQRAIAA